MSCQKRVGNRDDSDTTTSTPYRTVPNIFKCSPKEVQRIKTLPMQLACPLATSERVLYLSPTLWCTDSYNWYLQLMNLPCVLPEAAVQRATNCTNTLFTVHNEFQRNVTLMNVSLQIQTLLFVFLMVISP